MPKSLTDDQLVDIHISFHTRHLAEFNVFFASLISCFDKYKNGEELKEDEKISLREYAIARSIASLERYMEHLEEKNFSGLSESISKCSEIVGFLEQRQPDGQYKLTLFIEQDKKYGKVTAESLLDFYISLNRFVSFLPRETRHPDGQPRPSK